PSSNLFPYTTLFRSLVRGCACARNDRRERGRDQGGGSESERHRARLARYLGEQGAGRSAHQVARFRRHCGLQQDHTQWKLRTGAPARAGDTAPAGRARETLHRLRALGPRRRSVREARLCALPGMRLGRMRPFSWIRERLSLRARLLGAFVLGMALSLVPAGMVEPAEEAALAALDRVVQTDKRVSDLSLRGIATFLNAR